MNDNHTCYSPQCLSDYFAIRNKLRDNIGFNNKKLAVLLQISYVDTFDFNHGIGEWMKNKGINCYNDAYNEILRLASAKGI